MKAKQNVWFFFSFSSCPEERNSETYFSVRISSAVLRFMLHFGVNSFDSFTVGCKKTHKMQIRFEFTSGLLSLSV